MHYKIFREKEKVFKDEEELFMEQKRKCADEGKNKFDRILDQEMADGIRQMA